MRAVVVNSALVVLMTTVESKYQYLSILRSTPPINKTKATADTAEAGKGTIICMSSNLNVEDIPKGLIMNASESDFDSITVASLLFASR